MGSLRFLLALAVAGGHAASIFGFTTQWIFPGRSAVQIFYIVSGYLMAMILNGKYADTPHGNWIFYSNRIVKIFAPYFVVLVATVFICLLSKAVTGNALLLRVWFAEAGNMTGATWAFGLLTNVFIIGQEWGYLLIYRAGSLFYDLQAFEHPPLASQFTVIAPAWTLSIELMFYAIAPFIVRRHILLIAALAFVSYRLRWDGYHFGFYSEATNYRFFPFELSLFLYGSVCFRVGKLLVPTDLKWSRIITVATALTIGFIFVPKYFHTDQYQLYAVIGILLPALFDFSRRNNWDRALGDLSYPLYLVHFPALVFAATIGPSGSRAYATAAVLFSIGLAAIINRYAVEPIERWRQERVTGQPRPEAFK
jgi:peptidoglycan/LPS O-acetylase OafA/YrhL